jgi:hypothetical protein
VRFSITGPGRQLNLRSYPKADIAERGQNVRLVPGADITATCPDRIVHPDARWILAISSVLDWLA